jgi:EmrB/QacA subfamily drug resistance transporter
VASSQSEHERSHSNLTLAVLSLAALAYSLLQSLVTPALPTIQHAFGASESGTAWVLTAYLLSAAVATPILGRLGDIHGKRMTLIVVLAGLAVGTLVAAIATSLPLMIVGRVIQGFGGGVFPLAFGIIRDEFPQEKVAGSIGLVSALLGLGGGLGVVLAGVIVDNLSYHWLFWIPMIAVLVALLATIVVIPDSPMRAPAAINWLGAALMSIGLVAVLLAVSETSTWGWGSPKTLGLIAAGLVVLGLWVANELRAQSPLVDMRVMAIRGVWTTNLVAVLLGIGMLAAFVLIPQFAQMPEASGYGFGSSVTAAGLLLLPMALVMLVVGALAGHVERRFGSKFAVLAGAAFTLGAYVLLLVAHDSKLPIYIASAVLGVGIGLAFAAMANLIVGAVPPDQTGVATGMNTVARSVGAAFGGQLAATFVSGSVGAGGLPTVAGFNHAFLMAIIALVVALLAAFAIPTTRSRPRAGSRAQATEPLAAPDRA